MNHVICIVTIPFADGVEVAEVTKTAELVPNVVSAGVP